MSRFASILCLVLVTCLSHPAYPAWTPNGVPVCTDPSLQERVRTVTDGSGGVIAVWEDLRNNVDYDLFVQRVYTTGEIAWALNGLPVCTAIQSQSIVALVPDGSGGVVVVWSDSRNGPSDVFAQRLDATGSPMWAVDGVPVCSMNQSQGAPILVADGTGGVIVAWVDDWGGSQDIYVQRINGSGTRQWLPDDGVPVSTQVDHENFPVIVPDNAGGVIVGFIDHRNGGSMLRAQHINSSGLLVWSRGGVSLGTANSVVAAPDGMGGVIMAWDAVVGLEFDVRVRRVDAAGVAWPAPSNVAPSIPLNFRQNMPAIMSLGSGESIVAWRDNRGGTGDVYAQRFNGAGSAAWTANGVAVCTATGHQENPEIVTDQLGGVVLAWEDERNGSSNADIFSQRLDGSGVAQWAANGVAVCTAANDQQNHSIIAAGAGAAIVTWEDFRSGLTPDVFAHIVSSGPTAVDEPTPTPALELGDNVPNPFTGETIWNIGLPRDSMLRVDVYDVAGRLVRTMERHAKAGWQQINFDGRDGNARPLASGVYFYKVTAGGETRTHKMTLVR